MSSHGRVEAVLGCEVDAGLNSVVGSGVAALDSGDGAVVEWYVSLL